MRIFVWLVRAAIFFTLFAFALNNQQEAGIRWFFGQEWRAPMVFIVLAAFALGCAFGVFAMVPSWWRHRRVARKHAPAATATPVEPVPTTLAPDSLLPHRPAMDFDLQWLLLGLPLTFALGWLASRFDLRQWRREQKDSPKAYYKGLNLLLNEQQDKAIDAFIEAVQQDPDTSDLHFALGNLFRRRGEYERAVRVHEHLLHRADLPRTERDRAQHALAQDFMKAGLFDRAEVAYKALDGTSFDTEARLALLTLHERSRDWRAAAEVAQKLEQRGTGSFASRISHYWCEIALEADAKHQTDEADAALKRAREAAPQAARSLVLAGQRALRRAEHAEVLALWGVLLVAHPAAFNLVAREYAQSAVASGEGAAALVRLQELYQRAPTLDLLEAIALLDADPGRQRARLLAHLREHPSLSAAQGLLGQHADGAFNEAETKALVDAVGRAAQPLRRYRCAACGFEAQHYFWQCPGCSSWDSYPPQRLEDLA